MLPGRGHVYERLDFFRVGFYSAGADYETEELSECDSESTFLRVNLHPVLLDHDKRFLEVALVLLGGFGLHQHVINVDFHVPPQLVSEHLIHQTLVGSPGIL